MKTTWIDTNILSALYRGDESARGEARRAMTEAANDGWFAISACVYAELLAGPGMNDWQLLGLLQESKIPIAWQTGEDVWTLAAERFAAYASRRRAMIGQPKRFVADFLIGAQATVRGGRLLTFDRRI